jgi:hypothetical protein
MIDLDENWRFMVGVPVLLAVIQVFILVAAPRSPHFLIYKGFNEEARQVLSKLYPGGPEIVETEFQEIKSKMDKLDKIAHKRVKRLKHKCCQGCACLSSCPKAQKNAQLLGVNALELVQGSEKNQFFLVVLFAFFNQACGSTAIINYAPTIFEHVGVEVDDAIILSSALGATKLAGIVVSFFMIDSCGRRILFVTY